MDNKDYNLTEEQINIIRKIPLFRGISDELKMVLLDKLNYNVTSVKKGEIVIHQDTPCNYMHILLEGNLEVNIIDVSGNNIKVENIIAPRAFATPHLFNDNDIFPATFTAIEDGVLFRATKDSTFELISSNPELLKNFLKARGNCTACTLSRLRILSYKSIRSRFVYYIIDHKQSDTLSVMEHNQTQLAEYLGVTRPAFASELKKMINEELIEVDGRNVNILSYMALLKYI